MKNSLNIFFRCFLEEWIMLSCDVLPCFEDFLKCGFHMLILLAFFKLLRRAFVFDGIFFDEKLNLRL